MTLISQMYLDYLISQELEWFRSLIFKKHLAFMECFLLEKKHSWFLIDLTMTETIDFPTMSLKRCSILKIDTLQICFVLEVLDNLELIILVLSTSLDTHEMILLNCWDLLLELNKLLKDLDKD